MKKKKMNILILYKDKTYKIIPFKKIKKSELSKSNIKMIFIPLYENPNAYIPIKPSYLYDFHKARVSIMYESFIYDLEYQEGISSIEHNFYVECENIIDFINAIYNCYKFRGGSIYLYENERFDCGIATTFTILIRHIHIEFFNERNQLINVIDSGIMESGEDYPIETFMESPPSFMNEDRMNCLKDILYLPYPIKSGIGADTENLPICIAIYDNLKWKKISKPGKELNSDDLILYKISDFEVYYLMEYELYQKLIDFKEFWIMYVSYPDSELPNSDPINPSYLLSLNRNKVPSFIEKEEAVKAYSEGDMFSIVSTCADICGIDDLLQSMVFIGTIMNFIKYFGNYCYAGNSSSIRMKNFVIFGRMYRKSYMSTDIEDNILLTDIEFSYENIINAFLTMIMKGR